MYSMKTGALLEAACAMGAVCACHYDTHAAEEYARALGLAFQIKDDILDVTADEKVLGKPVHSDERNDKTTYVSLMGTDKAQEEAERLTALALERARMLPENGFITGLTRKLLERVS
jgi:geranylgeranyl diphosphate synthase type II